MKKYVYVERDHQFGQLIVTVRTHIGLTQAGLGEQLGVSRRAVAEWEAGSSYPKADHLKDFIALAINKQAFAAGHEVEEIRTLWKAAHLKLLLDEQWVRGLLLEHALAAHTMLPGQHDILTDLTVPLIGRTEVFHQLISFFQQVQHERAQALMLIGEAGIGKSRLSQEFIAWARIQGATVIGGRTIEMGGRLPYQSWIEALTESLEASPTSIEQLEQLWQVELSRLLPQLRLRDPGLPSPVESVTTTRNHLFEAVARYLSVLADSGTVILLLEDLHWADTASLDLLQYLGRYWAKHHSRILLLGTLRPEGLAPHSELAAHLTGLGRELPLRQILLPTLTLSDTQNLVDVLVNTEHQASAGEPEQHNNRSLLATRTAISAPVQPTLSPMLTEFLFEQTGGQPLYLLEMLKLLQEHGVLVPHQTPDGSWHLDSTADMVAVIARPEARQKLLPPSLQALIHMHLKKLSAQARQLVISAAVLGARMCAHILWQVADLPEPAGLEALEEATATGILVAVEGNAGYPETYRFCHEVVCNVVYVETGTMRRQILHQRAQMVLQSERGRASEIAYHALLAGDTETAYYKSVQAGIEAVAVFALPDAIEQFERARALLSEHPSLLISIPVAEIERLYTHLGAAYTVHNA